jgi:hypothetical protein
MAAERAGLTLLRGGSVGRCGVRLERGLFK